MKSKLFFGILATIAVLSCVTAILIKERASQEKSLIDQNIEALTQTEITVGTLCYVCPNSACSSLGEVFEERHSVD